MEDICTFDKKKLFIIYNRIVLKTWGGVSVIFLKKKSIKDIFILLWSKQSTLFQTSMSITDKNMDQKSRSNGTILQLI